MVFSDSFCNVTYYIAYVVTIVFLLSILKPVAHFFGAYFKPDFDRQSETKYIGLQQAFNFLTLLVLCFSSLSPHFLLLTLGLGYEILAMHHPNEQARDKIRDRFRDFRARNTRAVSCLESILVSDNENIVACINTVIQFIWSRYNEVLNKVVKALLKKVLKDLQDSDDVEQNWQDNLKNFFVSQYNAIVDVGWNPPTVEKIAMQLKQDKHIVVDIKCAFRSNCRVFVAGILANLLIKNPQVENVKLRVDIGFSSKIPVVKSISLSFIEGPHIEWDISVHSASAMTQNKKLAELISKLVIRIIREKALPPIKLLAQPIKIISQSVQTKLESLYLNVSNLVEDKLSFLMPKLDLVLTVTVHRAEDVERQTKNMFGCKKAGRGLVILTCCSQVFKTEPVPGANPVWNFTCEFLLEFSPLLNFYITLQDESNKPYYPPLGHTYQSLDMLSKKPHQCKWYNCSTENKAKILIETQVTKLARYDPSTDFLPKKGVLCFVIGQLELKDQALEKGTVNPVCSVKLYDGESEKPITILKEKSFKEESRSEEDAPAFKFNLLRRVRVKNFSEKMSRLKIEILDKNNGLNWIGILELSGRRLLAEVKTQKLNLKDSAFEFEESTLTIRTEFNSDQ